MQGIRDRYQRAMSVPQEDVTVKLARLLQQSPQGQSPFLGPQAAAALPAYQQPFAGLRNEPGLPPFEQPGSSLPMDRYMPAPGSQPQPQAPPMQQATPAIPAAPMTPPPVQPMTTEPVPQIGDPAVLALVEAMTKPKMPQWAVNEGSYRDQYGG